MSVISCGGGPEIKPANQTANKTPTPTPGEREISGVFSVTGEGTNGVDEYTGVLNLTSSGDVYSFRWATTKGVRIGTGVQLGNTAAASYAATGGGKGCGSMLYKIASDGSLEGRVAKWGETTFGTEKAVRTEGTGFVGKYDITGKTVEGADYKGRLKISKDGSGYDFEWEQQFAGQPVKAFVGFGIWRGSSAAASFGGKQCSFALYDIQSNGNLEGFWGGQKAVTFGTESAKRQ